MHMGVIVGVKAEREINECPLIVRICDTEKKYNGAWGLTKQCGEKAIERPLAPLSLWPSKYSKHSHHVLKGQLFAIFPFDAVCFRYDTLSTQILTKNIKKTKCANSKQYESS